MTHPKNLAVNLYSFRIFVPIVLCVGGLIVFLSLSMTNIPNSSKSESDHKFIEDKFPFEPVDKFHKKRSSNMDKGNFWTSVNLQDTQIPQSVKDLAKDVKIESKHVKILGINTFYREAVLPADASSSGQTLLLLHGASFKSQTWLDLNSIALLAAMGHRVVALDLPGYGETQENFSGAKEEFLKDILATLHLQNTAIVSPSMSGGYSIPFLIKYSSDLIGYIPVAPVSTNLLKMAASSIQTPTLIIYGELDTGLGVGSRGDLSLLPNSQVVVLPKARHPAYLDQPEMFHTLLYNFMNQLKSHRQ